MFERWRDPDTDSGLRLAHWLAESDERDVRIERSSDELGPVWTVELLEGVRVVVSCRGNALEITWLHAIESADDQTDTIGAPPRNTLLDLPLHVDHEI